MILLVTINGKVAMGRLLSTEDEVDVSTIHEKEFTGTIAIEVPKEGGFSQKMAHRVVAWDSVGVLLCSTATDNHTKHNTFIPWIKIHYIGIDL